MGTINSVLVLVEAFGPVKRQPTNHAESYKCSCPLHDDINDKLVITELNDGRVVMKCWRGCGAADILHHLGQTNGYGDVDWSILFPPKHDQITLMESVFGPRPKRKRTLDDHLLAVADADRRNGRRLTAAEKSQEFEAYKRIRDRGY